MKLKWRSWLACLLTAAMLLSAALPALAENGPFDEHYEDWYPAYLSLVVLDENEDPVTEMTEYGFPVNKSLPLYRNGAAVEQPGALYDKATNTLTLTDFHEGNYILAANMMGDDFALCVRGDCRLSAIRVYGDGWGGSLKITGDGTLTVNPNKKHEAGVFLAPEFCEKLTLTVDKTVTLKASGSETAIEVYGGNEAFAMTADGKAVAFDRIPAVRELYVFVEGYGDPMEEHIPLCRNAADPDGIYGINVWRDGPEDDAPIVNVTVDRWLYAEALDTWYVDQYWASEDGSAGPDLSFPDLEAAAAAGFTPITDEEGEQVWKTVTAFSSYGHETVFADGDGNRYIISYGRDADGHYGEFAYTFALLPGSEDLYFFTYAPGVDPEALTEITETHEIQDTFDYAFPGTEYVHEAGNPDDGPHFTLGDVDGDGSITASDARLALRCAVGLEGYAKTSPEFLAADVDFDETVTAGDARSILRAAVGLEDPASWVKA